nr:SpoIIE family protein phosphatase [Bacteroidota bacterium]
LLCDSIGSLDDSKFIEEELSKLYEQTHQPVKALEHYKKYIAIRDSLFNEENTKKSVRTEMTFAFEKKEALTKIEQEKKDALAIEKLKQQRLQRNYFIFGFVLVLLLTLFIFRSYHQKRQANIIIATKNKEITDSITYARRIQQAMLPNKEEIYQALKQSFILFKPKDIVSGDFYFFHKKNNHLVFIAAADCTGHGVPGAFMSMIGSEKLEDAVAQNSDTSLILKQLNKGIRTSLRQSDSDDSTRDGMDIALCSVDTEQGIIKYAGANRPLWVIRKGQTTVEEIKATKKAIGGLTEDEQQFGSHELKLQRGDTFYIFTDGYADQFSGHNGKKLMTRKFKEILLDIQNKTMQEQEKHLDSFMESWKAGTEQVDDILVIGVRL